MSQKLIYLISFVLVLAVGLTSEANAAPPGLIGWWKLDDGSGTIALDSSGLGNHGTLGPEGDPKWVTGHFGGALDLDGNDDYVEINAIADDIKTNNFSVSAWIKTTQTNDGNVVASNSTGGGHDFVFGVINGNLLVEADGLNEYPPKINDNQWHHIAYVRDGTTAYAYSDGVLVGTETPTGNPAGQARWSIGQEWDSGPSDEYDGIVDDVQIYNRPLTAAEIVQVMIGIPPGAASEPSPEDEAIDVPREVVLSWKPGEFTPPVNGHKIYLSENFNDVNDGIGGVTQSSSSYVPPQRLELNTTYYWRVNEVNGPPDFTVHESSVWSFTTEPLAYPVENITVTASSTGQPGMGPENTINGSGLDANDLHSVEASDMWISGDEPNGAWIEYEFDKVYKLHEMWVWNSNQMIEALVGFGLKDVTIEHSTNGTDYTTLGTTHEFARAPGVVDYAHNTTVDFGNAAAKFVRFTANSNWGGVLDKYGLSEVRFFQIPVHARRPSPDSGAADVDVDVVLGFRAGREADTHDVYLSSDEQAVIDGNAPVTTVTDASYGPLSLELNTTYYWKINEVNEAETPATWESDIWSFTTTDHIVVDGFEDYNDYPPDEIWNTWIDGYGVPTNGATVGYPDPAWSQGEHYVETTIVHGGSQAMPFFYSNTGGATHSEGARTFAVPQDWTANGAKLLSLWFFGTAGNTGQLYVKVNGTKVAYDGLVMSAWQVWNIDLASLGAGLQSVTTLAIGIDGNGASGTLYFDDIGLYVLAPAPLNEWRIADGSDDAEEAVAAGGMDLTSSDLELPYENTGQVDPQIIGVRFTGIPIPKGATITEAWVRFQVDETKGGTEAVNLIIKGELSPNPATFISSTAGDISSRPTTTAQVQWSVPNWTTVGEQGPDQTTPSIASIIQEIVNQDGWAGGAIVLIFSDDPTNPSVGIRTAEAGPGDDAALLHISYQ
ncbi:MAG: discoidin domain-containing protein [Planctomycetes bacterium]|nr:discoidin domain-containing protein [Planctomycetota bacterium]